jgi:hypothetical protein
MSAGFYSQSREWDLPFGVPPVAKRSVISENMTY